MNIIEEKIAIISANETERKSSGNTCKVYDDETLPLILHLPRVITTGHENAIYSRTALPNHAQIAATYSKSTEIQKKIYHQIEELQVSATVGTGTCVEATLLLADRLLRG